MAVKLELYRIFRTVAEEESISTAAKTLFISQSAVSQSIHQLEEQLQVRLFSRQPRGVTLTGEGRVLYDYVRSAISLIETGEEKVIVFNFSGHGHFDLASYDSFLSKKLEDYEYPEEKIKESLKDLPLIVAR